MSAKLGTVASNESFLKNDKSAKISFHLSNTSAKIPKICLHAMDPLTYFWVNVVPAVRAVALSTVCFCF